ncbi:MAG: DUF547 domain-containing protein [Pseudomonadota bacterium]
MRRYLCALVLALTCCSFSATVVAAPLWIERKFIPQPELIDPRYKILSETQSSAVDHSLWDDFLGAYVMPGADGINRVNYAAVDSGGLALLQRYIAAQEAIDTSTLSADQKLAYWINLYNAATVRLILQNYPIASIRKIKVDGKGPWDHPVVTVQAKPLTLGEIEHHIVRALFPDPRIHYALNCASIGCPNLAQRAYTAATLEDMLEAGAVAYVNHPRGAKVRGTRVDVSKIYGWYREDFGDDASAVLAHIKAYSRGALAEDLANVTRIGRYSYDWDLNEAVEAAGPAR